MISYRFEIADKDEDIQILLQDDMVEIANRLGIDLIISFKDYRKVIIDMPRRAGKNHIAYIPKINENK